MIVSFEEGAWVESLYWQKTDRKVLQKINELIKSIQREPFTGVGKPEKLRFDLSGYWSRRINIEHRLVYRVDLESEPIELPDADANGSSLWKQDEFLRAGWYDLCLIGNGLSGDSIYGQLCCLQGVQSRVGGVFVL